MDKTIASGDGLRRIAEAIRGAKLSFELDGAVVFGSLAKGKVTPDSDVDVLVVPDLSLQGEQSRIRLGHVERCNARQ
jgi:predicted nucleotidyltransferase